MIRIRIDSNVGPDDPVEGLVWYEDSQKMGRVIIEQQVDTDTDSPYWVPVPIVRDVPYNGISDP
jgi:hypothetical protein